MKKAQTNIDATALIENYLSKLDWKVNQDANVQYSFPGLTNYISEEITKEYALNNLIPEKAAQAHRDGDIYIHDLGKHLIAYCAGWDLRRILKDGISGVSDKCTTGPAKHLQTALDHAYRFIQIVCNEWAGAQAFSSIDTLMAPFIKKDKLNYSQVKNAIQSFIFNLNISTRYGGQIPFSNITLDWIVPDDLKNEPALIGGKASDIKYGDCQKEMDLFNKALIETYMDGDFVGQPFSFPIPTYNITKDFDWDSENAKLLFEMTAKYGNPYFQNFVNSGLKPSDVRAMCCRLRMDLTKLIKKTGGRWGSGASTGSICVTDINLPVIGYQSKGDEKKWFKLIEERMGICKEVHETKRKIVDKYMKAGLTPYTRFYLGTFEHHFSTISIIGMNEALRNFNGSDVTKPDGVAFAEKTIQFMLDKLVEFQKETGNIYNLEAAPNESCSYSIALKDKKRYPDIIAAGNGDPYYTNSTQLPVDYTDDVFEALDLQDKLQSMYTGGTVFHVFLGERLSSGEECKALVKKITDSYTLPYFSITPTFSICSKHGYIAGEAKSCPNVDEDGKPCEIEPLVYSRVVGFYRPVKQWNNGKKQEYKERKEFVVQKEICSCKTHKD